MKQSISKKLTKYVGAISPNLLFHLSYLHNHYRWPNLRNPKDLAEVIGRQCINGEINEFSVYADKIAVRQYIEKWVGSEYLPELYQVAQSFDGIDFTSLPTQFALKTNHGCGGNVICFDKETLDMDKAKQVIDKAMIMDFGGKIETHYSLIPRRVFAEQLLSDNGELPIDYKFHCWNGKIKTILCCVERGKGGHVRLKNYDTNWQPMHILKAHEALTDIPCPNNLDEMKYVAESIASHFQHVRVDLYSFKGKTYVGELTFTPEGGIMRYYTLKGLRMLAS